MITIPLPHASCGTTIDSPNVFNLSRVLLSLLLVHSYPPTNYLIYFVSLAIGVLKWTFETQEHHFTDA